MISIFTFASALSQLELSPITTAKRAKVQSEIKTRNERERKKIKSVFLVKTTIAFLPIERVLRVNTD